MCARRRNARPLQRPARCRRGDGPRWRRGAGVRGRCCSSSSSSRPRCLCTTHTRTHTGTAHTARAQVVMAALDKPRSFSSKSATIGDIVTDTDRASEAACVAAIQASFPDHLILGEEGGVIGSESDYLWCALCMSARAGVQARQGHACARACVCCKHARRRAPPVPLRPHAACPLRATRRCIDPIDGTCNFAHAYQSFCVSIGVLRHALPVSAARLATSSPPPPAPPVPRAAQPPSTHHCWHVMWQRCALFGARAHGGLPQVAGCVVEFVGGPGSWRTRVYKGARNLGSMGAGRSVVLRHTHTGARCRPHLPLCCACVCMCVHPCVCVCVCARAASCTCAQAAPPAAAQSTARRCW
jgi:hypothetical protein